MTILNILKMSTSDFTREDFTTMFDKLNDLNDFAASTGDEKYMEAAKALSQVTLKSMSETSYKKIKAEDIVNSAVDEICAQVKAAITDPISGKAEKTFEGKDESHKSLFEKAYTSLEADGFGANLTHDERGITVAITWL